MKTVIPELVYDEGVWISTQAAEQYRAFSETYLHVRRQEKRLLSIAEIRMLPFPAKTSPDYLHWRIRRKNINRFLRYLQHQPALNILDVGCGNGYFSQLLSKQGHQVSGLDVNLSELRLAAAAFGNNIAWLCMDLIAENIPASPFDIIVFNSSFHYFQQPAWLLQKCHSMLKPGGEIHILDSPFYTEKDRDPARERSRAYFSSHSAGMLIDYYHHHTLEVFGDYRAAVLYQPGGALQKIFRLKDSPFHWIRINNK